MPTPVISIAQMREWEQATWNGGHSEAEVIRQVGKCVARQALALTQPGDLILILAGKGHNGEDARCSREHLLKRRVEVLEVAEPAAELSKLEALLSLRPALVVDGLFGIGLNRPLSRDWMRFVQSVNEAGLQVLAVDVPSGLNADTGEPQGAAIEAAVTLTVGAPKLGLLQEAAWRFVGRLEVAAEVGLVPCPSKSELQWTRPADFAGYPPPRKVATHKGSYGHLAIVAGSLGYHGAAVLAARGAQRAQPGLITLLALEPVYPVIASQLQAVMVAPIHFNGPRGMNRLSPALPSQGPGGEAEQTRLNRLHGALGVPEHCSAVLVGPGLAAAEIPGELRALTAQLWSESPLAVVADASALTWLPRGHITSEGLRVMTPHPGEAARLLATTTQQVQAERLSSLRELSRQFGNAWVVLKGHQTLIGRGAGEVRVNSSGNPQLAQGGSGDVLSGYLAGLLTQPRLAADPFKTICFAVWQHGAAADRLQAVRRNWVVEDLVKELGASANLLHSPGGIC